MSQQLGMYNFETRDVFGQAIPGLTVIVLGGYLSQVSVLNQPGYPMATIYSDPLGANVINQAVGPLLTNAFGQAFFCALPGYYTLQIYGNGIANQLTQQISIPAGPTYSLSNLSVTGLSAVNAQFDGSPWYDVKAFGAVGNCKVGSDGQTTASSTTLVSPSAPFTTADIGKVVQVQYAGASSAPLLTTIAGYVSATTVTMAAAASESATGQMFFWGTDDSTAFQNAINAGVAAGVTVFVPAANYLVSQGITIGSEAVSGGCNFLGTLGAYGVRVIAIGGSIPSQYGSTIIDGSGNNTLTVGTNANEFTVKGLNFLSFPNSLGKFVYLTSRVNDTDQSYNGLVEDCSMWGKSYGIYGDEVLELITIRRCSVGCANIGGIYFITSNEAGHNKNTFDNNYVELQNFAGTVCGIGAPSPLYGIAMTSPGGSGGIPNNMTITNNISQLDNYVAGSYGILCGGCSAGVITGNDVESQRSGGGFQYPFYFGQAGSPSVGSVGMFIGPNTYFGIEAVTTVMTISGASNYTVLPQFFNDTGGITNGVLASGLAHTIYAPISYYTMTNPVALYSGATNCTVITNVSSGLSLGYAFTSVGFGESIPPVTAPVLGESFRIAGSMLIGAYGGGASYGVLWSPADQSLIVWQAELPAPNAGLAFGTGTTIGTNTIFEINGSGVNVVSGVYKAGGTSGVSCSGTPSASFAVVNGIVTHC